MFLRCLNVGGRSSINERWTHPRMWSGRTGLAPLVLGERGCSITFVLDTSERMKAVLGSVKRLLIQALQTKASTGDSTFNLVTFSHTVRPSRTMHNIHDIESEYFTLMCRHVT